MGGDFFYFNDLWGGGAGDAYSGGATLHITGLEMLRDVDEKKNIENFFKNDTKIISTCLENHPNMIR